MAKRERTSEYETVKEIRAMHYVENLVEEVVKIRSVREWASKVSTSEKSLYRLILNMYDKTPGEILREVRYEKIVMLMNQDTEAGAYCIALESGFNNEDALRMFLRRCHDTNIRTLRREVMNGKLQMEWEWLNNDG